MRQLLKIRFQSFIYLIQNIQNLMTSLENLRKSIRFGELELGLDSIASPRSKESGTTAYSPRDSLDENIGQRAEITPKDREFSTKPSYTIDELKLKLLKMREYKSSMQLKFKNHISILQGEISAMDEQNILLKKLSQTAKKDTQQIKSDLRILKNCIANRQPVSYLQPESSNLQKWSKAAQRQNSKIKPNRLFKPCVFKAK